MRKARDRVTRVSLAVVMALGCCQIAFAQSAGAEDSVADTIMTIIRTCLWAGGTGVAVLLVILFMKQFLYVCRPNEVLIFSGGKHKREDGADVGYRVIFGGRAWRVPFLETVQRMDMRTMPCEVQVENAYTKVGIPLAIRAVANVKISSEPSDILNAIERFLGKPPSEIRKVVMETMEGNLRGVLATLTPEEVNEDRLKFADSLVAEAGHDLKKLGMMMDTLKIQAVSDQVNYLDSIGRKGISEVIRDAEIVESNCAKEANKVAADAEMQAKVARADADREVIQSRNELRRVKADLEAEARSAELKADASAQQARAEAEQELQKVRQNLEALRLEADVIVPADIDRQAQELLAAGEAAPIMEEGRAVATAARLLSDSWLEAGEHARDIFVLSRLDDIAEEVSAACQKVHVREVHLIDDGSGVSLPRYAAAYPNMLAAVLRSVYDASGVNILEVVGTATSSTDSGDLAHEYGEK